MISMLMSGDVGYLIDAGVFAIAQLLTKQTWKIAFMFEGAPDGGKTTILELMRLTFGCCSDVGLTALCGNRFASSDIDRNLLNIADEASNMNLERIEYFKKITGSVYITVEEKMKPRKPTIMTAVHVFACNDLPSKGLDEAFWSRWDIRELKNKFPKNPLIKTEIHSQKVREQYLYLH